MRTLNSKVGAATSTETTRADKQSVNTKTNNLLNFLVGLSAVLMLAFVFMELQSKSVESSYTFKISKEIETEANHDVYRIEQPEPRPKTEPIAKTTPTIAVNQVKPPIIFDDMEPEPTVDILPTATITDTAPVSLVRNPSTDTSLVNQPIESFNMMTLSEIPLFPGCNSKFDSDERIDCLNEKMARFVQRHFDTSLGNEIQGTKLIRITVLFTIGTDGMPKDIQVKAPNEKLKKEAFKTIGKLPKMIPGKVNGAAVNTTYALPIMFKIES